MITSPEYHMKRLLARGPDTALFQICRCFRGEEDGPRHRPEFTMVEWYRCGTPYQRIMSDVERLVAVTAHALRDSTRSDVVDLQTPWPRIRVHEAFQRYAGVDLHNARTVEMLRTQARAAGCVSIDAGDDWSSAFHKLLVERVEPGLAAMGRGVHLLEYPASEAALAQLEPGQTDVAQRFESYAGGLELANGFGELTDARQQRRRFRSERTERQNTQRPVLPLDEAFLRDLHNMPPASGVALGLDRLLMLATAADHIDDVVAF